MLEAIGVSGNKLHLSDGREVLGVRRVVRVNASADDFAHDLVTIEVGRERDDALWVKGHAGPCALMLSDCSLLRMIEVKDWGPFSGDYAVLSIAFPPMTDGS